MKYTILSCLFLLIVSCKNDPPSAPPDAAQTEAPAPDALPEGFTAFYEQYHTDSAYQMEHTVFPLEGIPANADSLAIAEGTYRWTPENWRMMRTFDVQMSEFTRELRTVNERMVVELIVHKTNGHGMVRRFAVVAGEWHLIYYAGMNKLR